MRYNATRKPPHKRHGNWLLLCVIFAAGCASPKPQILPQVVQMECPQPSLPTHLTDPTPAGHYLRQVETLLQGLERLPNGSRDATDPATDGSTQIE